MSGASTRGLALAATPVYLFLAAPMLVVLLFSLSTRSYLVFPPEGVSLQWYRRAWESGAFARPALLSVEIAGLTAVLSALVATPAALGLRALRGRPIRAALEFILLLPILVPALITGIGLLYYLGAFGVIDTFGGLLAAHVLIGLPFALRAILVSADAIDAALLEAAAILGASRWRAFRTVTLPALTPGLISGAVFAAVVSFDQFTISLFVTQDRQVTLPVALYKYLYDVNDPVAAAVSSALILLGLAVALGLHSTGVLTRSLTPR